MDKTSAKIDSDTAKAEARVHGTVTSNEIANAQRRRELVELFSEAGRFDFEAADDAWGASSGATGNAGAED
jgi:hypothetical protein